MKIKVISLTLLLISTVSIRVANQNDLNSTTTTKNEQSKNLTPEEKKMQENIGKIFDFSSLTSDCNPARSSPYAKEDYSLPFESENPYSNARFSSGPVAILGDFLDPLLLEEFIKEAKKILNEVKSIKLDEGHSDEPYSTSTMFIRKTGKELKSSSNPNGITISEEEQIKAINYDLDPKKAEEKVKTYLNGITLGQVSQACSKYNWSCGIAKKTPLKSNFDKYDFDGNGRLDPLEFLLFHVSLNADKIAKGGCTGSCFNNMMKKFILPMFGYLDCDGNGKITAEQIWDGLKTLKRNTDKYNLYEYCDVTTGSFNTNVMTAFTLNSKTVLPTAILSREDFSRGLLVLFTLRQADKKQLYDDDTINGKKERWANKGEYGEVCRQITTK